MSDSIRRDPGPKWDVRNRLHPLHGDAAGATQLDGAQRHHSQNVHGVGLSGPTASSASTAAVPSRRRKPACSAAVQVQLPLIRCRPRVL